MTFWVTERQYVAAPILKDDGSLCGGGGVSLLQAPKLPVRENDAGQIFVANLSSLPVSTEEEFQSIYSWVAVIFRSFNVG